MLLLTETQIHHYRLQLLLGHGGMSNVYLASDEHLHRNVALKLVQKSRAEHLERFQREVSMIGSLEHDHILPVLAYGEYSSWCYLVMPYMAYGSLHEKIKTRGPLTQEEAGVILEQIAGALQHAHQQGFLHRDVKPANILLRDDSYAYLADFGLAKEQIGGTDLTLPGFVMGTLEYLAPELQNPFAAATPSSDLYALGVVLYEMLTGQVPFRGETTAAMCWQQLHQQPTRPSVLQPKLSPAIDDVILRALAKDPSQRFQTPQEFSEAYQQAIRHRPVTTSLLNSEGLKRIAHVWQGLPTRLHIGIILAVLMLLLSPVVFLLRSNGTTKTGNLPARVSTSAPTTHNGIIPPVIPTAPVDVGTPPAMWAPGSSYMRGDTVLFYQATHSSKEGITYHPVIYRCKQSTCSGTKVPPDSGQWEEWQHLAG